MPVPSGRQVLIKIHYTAVNRADTLQRQGSYPVPPGESQIIGLECSGEVTALADGCTGSFKVGDMVMAILGGGGYAEYAVADERSVMPIPASFGGDTIGFLVMPRVGWYSEEEGAVVPTRSAVVQPPPHSWLLVNPTLQDEDPGPVEVDAGSMVYPLGRPTIPILIGPTKFRVWCIDPY